MCNQPNQGAIDLPRCASNSLCSVQRPVAFGGNALKVRVPFASAFSYARLTAMPMDIDRTPASRILAGELA